MTTYVEKYNFQAGELPFDTPVQVEVVYYDFGDDELEPETIRIYKNGKLYKVYDRYDNKTSWGFWFLWKRIEQYV